MYLNGQLLANAQQDTGVKIHPFVLILDVSHSLRNGHNVLALAVNKGKHLAVKIVPLALGENGQSILMSGPGWKYTTQEMEGWEKADFDDDAWQPAALLGGMESNIDFFQANQDAALYQWPGYDGISPFLARVPIRAARIIDVFPGLGAFHGSADLAAGQNQLTLPPDHDFTVDLPPQTALPTEYPSLVLDFGRESTGRLEVISGSDAPMRISLQYGESLGETLEEPYLGIDELTVPPHATAYGPKSAFRYVKVRFLSGSSPLRFKTIQLDDIYYPVHYRGSFESSDPLLNRIWMVGAYTSHLCMQDDIWDAPKRDRARWMGDLDVSGHVIDIAFADRFLMQQTMDHLIRDAGRPVNRAVNTIPGYSAFWVMGEADYYRHLGDRKYLESIHQPLVQLLNYMEGDL
ncbi:MAG: alpha-L-rhamnosidase C-terminal domain-containing protein, partial [Terriglobia bacterium]